MSKTSVAAPSPSIGASVATLALALVCVLEAGGVYALSQGPSQPAVVAGADGATVYAPARTRVASVEITIVAQADATAH
jgi:hypothetical protein